MKLAARRGICRGASAEKCEYIMFDGKMVELTEWSENKNGLREAHYRSKDAVFSEIAKMNMCAMLKKMEELVALAGRDPWNVEEY